MSNYIEGSSESLVIAEGKQDFQINSSEERPKQDDDLFDLSQDEPSLSFQIEEGQKMSRVKQLCRKSKDDTLELRVIDQMPPEENRKKRKEIFDRYKKDKSVSSKVEESRGGDNLLNIFDAIFNKKSDGPAGFCGVFDMSSSKDSNRPILEGISIRSRTPSAEKRRNKIFQKKNTTETYQSVLPSNILEDKQSFHNPRIMSKAERDEVFSPIKANVRDKDDSLNFETLEKRVSLIQPADHDISRDSYEINTILESEIFREEQPVIKELPLEERSQRQSYQLLIPKQIEDMLAESSRKDLSDIPTVMPLPKQSTEGHMFKKKPTPVVEIFDTGNMRQSEVASMRQSDSLINALDDQPKHYTNNNMPMEETKYISNNYNDTSSLSSTPSMFIQNYDSRKLVLNTENSMVNVPHRNYEEVLTPRTNQLDKQATQFNHLNENVLAESKYIENIEKINVTHDFDEEVRLPIFLRRSRKLISVYPNFYILSNSPNTPELVINEFFTLIEELKKAIRFLCDMCQKVLDVKAKKQLYMEEIMTNISVQGFLEAHCKDLNRFQESSLIQPFEPVDVRGWNYEKAKTALSNYETVVSHYGTKGLKLDLRTEKGKKKYFQIRQKFWDICGNMKLISQDIYCQMRHCTLPSHYSTFRQYLSSPFPGRLSGQRLKQVQNLTTKCRHLKNENDPLVNSPIGMKIMERLQLQMRYLMPF